MPDVPKLPLCPPSPKELLAAKIKELDPRGPYAQMMDDAAADRANAAEGLLDLPNVADMLDQASNFLASIAGDLVSTFALDSLADAAGSVLGASGILSLMVAINMLGDTMSMMMQMLIIDNLRKQVAIRLFWVQQVQIHTKAIYQLLLMMKTAKTTPTSYAQILMALKHVVEAEKNINKFKSLEDPNTGIPKLQAVYFKKTFVEADMALKILMNNSASGDVASGLAQGLRKSISTRGFNSNVFNKAKADAWATIKKRAIAKILGRSLYITEGLLWHTLRLLPPIPIPALTSAVNKYTGSFNQAVKLGYTEGERFDSEKARKVIDKAREASLQTYASVDKTPLQQVMNKVNTFDFDKGITGTNIVITGYIDTLLSFKSSWDQLNKMSDYLLSAATPVESLLSDVHKSMQSTMDEKASNFVVDMKKVMWISQLSLLDTYKKMFSGAIDDQAQRADQARALRALKEYLASDVVQAAPDNVVLSLLKEIALAAPGGLVSSNGMKELLVTVKLTIKENDGYIKYNQQLFANLSTVSLSNDPTVAAINSLLTGMSAAGGLAGAMAEALALGNLASFASLMAISIASIAGLKALGMPKCSIPARSEDAELQRMNEINGRAAHW